MANFNTRNATPEDMDTLWQMQLEMYETQRLSDVYTIIKKEYRECIFGEKSVVNCIIATASSRDRKSAECVIGFASYYYSYSSHIGKKLFLEDLYIKKRRRRSGYGKAMMKALSKIALENNCQELLLECHDWNEGARSFYKSLNMPCKTALPKFVMEKDALRSFATESKH